MKLPIGIQSFEKIRTDGYVYVDKTDLVYRLAQGHIYFLCRPRRFGKSLLLSTLKAYFEGRRDLFEGLKMAERETQWTQYPVLHIDFNGERFERAGVLHRVLVDYVEGWERQYGVSPSPTAPLGIRFRDVIAAAHRQTGRRVVVLIDEYDKPLLDVLGIATTTTIDGLTVTVEEDNRQELKAFYSVFKATDDHLRFVMLTGVTKFSQISVFSGFNQPDDISLDPRYDSIVGITEEELYSVFGEHIKELADANGWTVSETKAQLKRRYDGYHFSERLVDMYNPFSILNAFSKQAMRDYWFASGTPTYLVRLLGQSQEELMAYTTEEYGLDEFLNYKADVAKPLPMIFQSGYLTIRSVDREFELYRLDYPNNEVRQGLLTLMTNNYLQPDGDISTNSWIQRTVRSLQAGRSDEVGRLFTAFLAGTPYQMRPKKPTELYFHYTLYLLMRLISCYTVYTEHQNSQGRCDCVVETPQHVYIFEFKLDGTAREALQQIHDRGYARPYAADPRQLHLIGATFSSETGTIAEWNVER